MRFRLAGRVSCVLGLLAGALPASAQQVAPNLVVVMTDDLDVASMQTALQQGLMPNLKAYVSDPGLTFSNSFVTFPLCCPSRATYLTGLYPHNTGVLWNSGGFGGFANFDDSSTLATWLQAAGYRTGHVGKYLNGYESAAYVPPGWDDWQTLVDPGTYCMYDYSISDNGVAVAYGDAPADYQTDVLRQRALDFVAESEGDDGAPFFLTVTPLAPHLETSCHPAGVRGAPRHVGSVNLPLPTPASFNEADMSDKPLWMRALPLADQDAEQSVYNDRLTSLRAVDDLVGALMASLVRHGELERTALVFTSDNGYLLGKHRWESKVLAYEESIRVPLLLRTPGPAAGTVTALVLNNDLAPTLADYAGATPGLAVDGRSLRPLIDGTATDWRRRFLVEHPPTGESYPVPPYLAVRTARSVTGAPLSYIETYNSTGTLTTARELYDLTLDPLQLGSLHADMSPLRVAQRQSLARHLQYLRYCGGGTCQTFEDQP
jgi:arylsulfatase A-like enzyme